jgi:hypothetical protein
MKGELQYYTTNVAVVYEMPTPSGIVLMTNHFVVTIPVGQTISYADTSTTEGTIDGTYKVLIIIFLILIGCIRFMPKTTHLG